MSQNWDRRTNGSGSNTHGEVGQQHWEAQAPLPPPPRRENFARDPALAEAQALAELEALKERALRAPLKDVFVKPDDLRIFDLELQLLLSAALYKAARDRLAVSAAAAQVLVQAADRLYGLEKPA